MCDSDSVNGFHIKLQTELFCTSLSRVLANRYKAKFTGF